MSPAPQPCTVYSIWQYWSITAQHTERQSLPLNHQTHNEHLTDCTQPVHNITYAIATPCHLPLTYCTSALSTTPHAVGLSTCVDTNRWNYLILSPSIYYSLFSIYLMKISLLVVVLTLFMTLFTTLYSNYVPCTV